MGLETGIFSVFMVLTFGFLNDRFYVIKWNRVSVMQRKLSSILILHSVLILLLCGESKGDGERLEHTLSL